MTNPLAYTFQVDTVTLNGRVHVPASDQVMGLVLFVHGNGLSPAIYGLVPDSFTNAGLAFGFFHQRAHSGTAGENSYRGTGQDAYRVADFLKEKIGLSKKEAPLFLMTHSAGGAGIFQNFFEEGLRPDALATICPTIQASYFRYNSEFRIPGKDRTGNDEWLRQIKADAEVHAELKRFLSNPDWVYHPEWLEGDFKGLFLNKPATWGAHRSHNLESMLRNWQSVISLEDEAQWQRVDFPVLTILAGQDEWIDPVTASRIHSHFGNHENEIIVVPDANHLMMGQWREICRDTCRFFLKFI